MLNNKVKVFSSLSTPILIAGVSRHLALCNGTICLAFVIALQSFSILPICLLAHLAAILLCKKDPSFFSVAIRHLRYKSYYDV